MKINLRDEAGVSIVAVSGELDASSAADLEKAIDRLLAEDYRYVSDAGLSLTKEEILTLFRTGNVHYDYLTTSDPKIEVDSDLNKGAVSGRARSKGHFRQQPFTDSYFYKNTYEKRDGRWQLVSGLAWHHREPMMQYFGYLRRNPDDAPDRSMNGYNFWLNKLNQFNGNFVSAEMVKAFIDSSEYRRRFAP